MNATRLLSALLSFMMCGHALAQVQDIDKELSDLADRLAVQIKDQGKKKVAVNDFADLQGTSQGELGKYIAEQLTVDFVMGKRGFSVLDRANLRSILAEHKLTATGLVDPDNAKKLGMFAGVDALILGTIIPKGTNITLNAKIITTDTAEIVGAARAEFNADETVKGLVSKPVAEGGAGGGLASLLDEKPLASKTFGDLRVDVQSLRIVNDNQYLLTTTLTNQNPKRSIWVALNTDMDLYSTLKAKLTDSGGSEFQSDGTRVSGIAFGPNVQYGYQGAGIYKATKIKARDSISATIKFASRARKAAAAGQCNLQVEFLLSHDFSGGHGTASAHNLTARIEAQ